MGFEPGIHLSAGTRLAGGRTQPLNTGLRFTPTPWHSSATVLLALASFEPRFHGALGVGAP